MSYVLIGAYKPKYASVGFQLPVFRETERNSYYYQQVSGTDRIEAFIPARSGPWPDQENFFHLPSPQLYKEDGPAAYFFLGEDGGILAGRLQDIRLQLAAVLDSPDYDAYNRLEVAAALQMYGYINNTILHFKWNDPEGNVEGWIDKYTVREDFITFDRDSITLDVALVLRMEVMVG